MSTLHCVKLYLLTMSLVDVKIQISVLYFVTLWHIEYVALYVQLAWKTFYWKWLILPSPVLTQVQRGCALIRSVSLVPVGVECSLEITNDKALQVKGVKTWAFEVIFKRCLTSSPHTLRAARGIVPICLFSLSMGPLLHTRSRASMW